MTRLVLTIGWILAATPALAQDPAVDEAEVWAAIQSTWRDFQSEEIGAFLDHYHPAWRRWGHRTTPLWDLEALSGFAEEIWGMGEVEAFELEPVSAILVGDAALVHYRVKEIYRTLDGTLFDYRFRWSDFLVKLDGRWLLIGGSRDDTCAVDENAVNRCPAAE